MGSVLDRISQIVQSEGINVSTMERAIGASKGVLSRAINNGTDIQNKWVQAIVENYPRYSAEWLITGNGNMLKDGQQMSNSMNGDHNMGMIGSNYVNISSNPTTAHNKIIADYKQKINRLTKTNEEQQQTIKTQQTKITFLEREVETLRDSMDTLKELAELYKKNAKLKDR
jgi:hypothetical protein